MGLAGVRPGGGRSLLIENDLNDLGREGWQALSTIAPSYGAGQAMETAVILMRANV